MLQKTEASGGQHSGPSTHPRSLDVSSPGDLQNLGWKGIPNTLKGEKEKGLKLRPELRLKSWSTAQQEPQRVDGGSFLHRGKWANAGSKTPKEQSQSVHSYCVPHFLIS